ncbi:hypothetical protein BMR07_09620 [Methylococcaceae bacterium CS1]|nr:hypothetical protein BMR07_09620 [Methylococcaceae bacterium CS1]
MDGIDHTRVTGFIMCIHAHYLSGKCKSAPCRLVRPAPAVVWGRLCRNDKLKNFRIQYQVIFREIRSFEVTQVITYINLIQLLSLKIMETELSEVVIFSP